MTKNKQTELEADKHRLQRDVDDQASKLQWLQRINAQVVGLRVGMRGCRWGWVSMGGCWREAGWLQRINAQVGILASLCGWVGVGRWVGGRLKSFPLAHRYCCSLLQLESSAEQLESYKKASADYQERFIRERNVRRKLHEQLQVLKGNIRVICR